jgi:phthiocerol/phenolphthiocerol synthesis type-I polyketide synthase E
MVDKIAIIGMAGLFPGANNYHQFWNNLCAGTVSSEIMVSNVMPTNFINAKGHIFDPEGFTPQQYNISEKEAEVMDPQLRKFIELADSALTDAKYPQGKKLGRVSVIASQGSNQTYHNELTKLISRGEISAPNQFLENINKGADFMASRAAYIFDFQGPCFNLQSACSSSLTAIVEGCWMLQARRTDAVICGGVHISWPLQGGYFYEAGSIYSKTGVCRPFDHAADGTLPSDGGGVVVLKRLSDALRDNDDIHALVIGAQSNNDGSQKMSYAAPSVNGQYQLLQEIYKRNGINPRELQFIECHATGTILGDPIEVKGIQQLMQDYPYQDGQSPVMLGSVKGNIGHLFWASGIASLIKSVLSVKYGVYPATANIDIINPLLRVEHDDRVRICTRNTALCNDEKVRAGISSTGVGGTNAHLIIERHHQNWQLHPKWDAEANIKRQNRYSLLPQHKNSNIVAAADECQSVSEQPACNILQQIITIWRKALGDSNISADSDFFDLYGDSITAIDVITLIKRQLDVEISSDTIYNHPTPTKLANYVRAQLGHHVTTTANPLPQVDTSIAPIFNTYQARFYLLEKLQRGQLSHYNVPLCLEIPESFPRKAFTQALEIVLSALPQFNLQCMWTRNGLELGPERKVLLSEEQLIVASDSEPGEILNRLFGYRFALEKGVVCKLSYVNWKMHNYLVINFPHLLIDGSGLHNLLQALEETLISQSVPDQRFIPPLQQKKWSEDDRQYWQQQLAGKQVTQLDASFPAADTTLITPGYIHQGYDHLMVERIKQLARKYKTSPFEIWYSTFNAYLSVFLAQDIICTGTTVANRNRQEMSAIGCYINNLPIVVNCSSGDIATILHETATVLREAMQNARIPLDVITRDAGGTGEELYDILFMYQNQNRGYQLTIGEESLNEAAIRYQPIYSSLSFNLVPVTTGIDMDITFNHSRYSYDYIEAFSNGYRLALDQYLIELEN